MKRENKEELTYQTTSVRKFTPNNKNESFPKLFALSVFEGKAMGTRDKFHKTDFIVFMKALRIR